MLQFIWRVVTGVIRLMLVLWFMLAVVYAAVDHAGYGDRIYARLWTAAEDAALNLPGIIARQYVRLVAQLGRDPLDVSLLDLSSVVPGLGGTGLQGPVASQVTVVARQAALSGAGLALAQTIILLVAVLRDTGPARRIGWRAPGVVRFTGAPGLRIRHVVLTGAAAAALVFLSARSGIGAGIASAIAVLIVLRYPIGGLPLWLLDVLCLRPRVSFDIRGWFRSGRTGPSDGSRGSDGAGSGWFGDDREGSTSSSQDNGQIPEWIDMEARFRKACEVLGLKPRGFSRSDLIARRRKLQRVKHPDAGGSHEASKEINEAYDFIIQFLGWRR